MALGSEVDDTIDLLFLHELVESLEVADVHLHELIVRLILDVLEVGKIAGIRQLIEVDDVILGIFVHEQANYVASDKACTAGDNDCLHNVSVYC